MKPHIIVIIIIIIIIIIKDNSDEMKTAGQSRVLQEYAFQPFVTFCRRTPPRWVLHVHSHTLCTDLATKVADVVAILAWFLLTVSAPDVLLLLLLIAFM